MPYYLHPVVGLLQRHLLPIPVLDLCGVRCLARQCVEFDECDLTHPFVMAGKAVFVAEYSVDAAVACAVADQQDLSLILKDLGLAASAELCP